MFEFLRDEITLRLGHLNHTPSGFMKRNCMMCASRGHSVDQRKRFGISFADGMILANCFNCGFKLRWQSPETLSKSFQEFLLKIGFVQADVNKIQFELFRIRSGGSVFKSEIEIRKALTSSWETIELPDGSLSLQQWKDHKCDDDGFLLALAYSEKRELRNLNSIYWTPYESRGLNKRIIIPFYYRNEIVGYTARYSGEIKNKNLPKYLNTMPKSYVYNLDNQIDYDRKYIILTEGPIDALLMDGISTLGDVSSEQADLIDSLNKEVIVSPDREKNGDGLLNMALNRGWSVSFPPWEKDIKDAGEAIQRYGLLLTVKSIIDYSERNPVAIRVKRKFDI